MKRNVHSPLPICELTDSCQLSPYQTIGLVADLAIRDSQYRQVTVSSLISRLILALEAGQAKVFFDDEKRPYGYASWALVPEIVHQSLLEGKGSDSELATYFSGTSGTYLWFYDLLCPFCSSLYMLKALKQELASHNSAHLLRSKAGNTVPARRLW